MFPLRLMCNVLIFTMALNTNKSAYHLHLFLVVFIIIAIMTGYLKTSIDRIGAANVNNKEM